MPDSATQVRELAEIIQSLRTRLDPAPAQEPDPSPSQRNPRKKFARITIPTIAFATAMTGALLRMTAPVDQIVLRGPRSVVKSAEPLARCQSIEGQLLSAGLVKDSQVIVVSAADASTCRVIAMDLDSARDRTAAANVFNREGLQVEPSGRLEVSITKRD